MYTARPWTIRQYAGFSTAEESNAFYKVKSDSVIKSTASTAKADAGRMLQRVAYNYAGSRACLSMTNKLCILAQTLKGCAVPLY
jgi:hypothetical protein